MQKIRKLSTFGEFFNFYIMRDKLTIQQWEAEERPREKFITKGGYALSNAELLAILIRSGNRKENAVELARKILHQANNNLSELKKFSFYDFSQFNGIGKGKAIPIMAAFELAKRLEMEKHPEQDTIYSSKQAADTMIPVLRDMTHEECWVLYLNTANKLIAKERITSGGINSTIVDVKMIIKSAISKLACSIILVHNHPSGSKRPGDHDKVQTARLKKAAESCDLELIDHIIIAGNSYFSFLDEGLL